jgi:hypothetical protein
VNATVNLTVQFFVIYLLQALVRIAIGMKGFSQSLVKLDASLQLAGFTVNMAPMLCVLFVGERAAEKNFVEKILVVEKNCSCREKIVVELGGEDKKCSGI